MLSSYVPSVVDVQLVESLYALLLLAVLFALGLLLGWLRRLGV